MPSRTGLFGVLGRARSRRAVSPEWSSVTGTVLSATVQVGTSGSARTEQPLVFYAYQVDGSVYQGNKVHFSCDPGAVVSRCSAGSAVTVFYDPADPGNSTLRL